MFKSVVVGVAAGVAFYVTMLQLLYACCTLCMLCQAAVCLIFMFVVQRVQFCYFHHLLCLHAYEARVAAQASANAMRAQDEKVLKKMEEHVVAEDAAEKALSFASLFLCLISAEKALSSSALTEPKQSLNRALTEPQ